MNNNSKKPKTLLKLIKNLEPLEQKVKELDFRSPQTSLYEIQQYLNGKLEGVPEESQKATILAIFDELKAIDYDTIEKNQTAKTIQKKKELVEKDNRIALLFQLIGEADKVAPLISFFILHRKPYLELNEEILECASLQQDCEEVVGERRAKRIAAYYHEVSERLYDNYVRIIWELWRISQNHEIVKSYMPFGYTINLLKQQLPEHYQPLIDFDGAWYRNATAHKDQRYLPAENVLQLKNTRKSPEEIRKICADCLYFKANDIVWMAGMYLQKVWSIYLQKNYYQDTGLMRLIFEFFKEVDWQGLDDEKMEVFKGKMAHIFSGVVGYQLIRKKVA